MTESRDPGFSSSIFLKTNLDSKVFYFRHFLNTNCVLLYFADLMFPNARWTEKKFYEINTFEINAAREKFTIFNVSVDIETGAAFGKENWDT